MIKTPAHIQPYVDVLGHDGAIKFILAFGGAPVHLTERPSARSQVVALVGMQDAKRLGKRFGAGYVRVPVAKPWIAQYLHSQGNSVFAIARTLHMTDSTVRKYLKPDQHQLEMFPGPDASNP